VIDARARILVAIGEMILHILKSFALCSRSLLEMLILFSLCVAAEISVAPANSGMLDPLVSSPRTAPHTPTVLRRHLLVCHLYVERHI